MSAGTLDIILFFQLQLDVCAMDWKNKQAKISFKNQIHFFEPFSSTNLFAIDISDQNYESKTPNRMFFSILTYNFHL